ncbi:MAG: response regulator transcription factor [Thermoflexales bacterium]|nr:response regulator transcription factor [Thermoflexales bacterium]
MAGEHILVVDDEPRLVRLINEILRATGYRVTCTGSGEQALKLVSVEQPALVLLDIILPGELDGYEICRRVREFSSVPVIMITARARESDILRGFDLGADDYITKPFSAKELLARVRAVLKRGQQASQEEVQVTCGALRVNLAQRRVFVRDKEIHLTATEYQLLHQLVIHRGRIVSQQDLLAAVWGAECRDDVDYLRAYIRYLRKKLEDNPSQPQRIVTVSGMGYMLSCDEPPYTPSSSPAAPPLM